jgi:hypothetical protein
MSFYLAVYMKDMDLSGFNQIMPHHIDHTSKSELVCLVSNNCTELGLS